MTRDGTICPVSLWVPAAGVVGPVYNIADIADIVDPHYQEGKIRISNTRLMGILPKFSETPGGGTSWSRVRSAEKIRLPVLAGCGSGSD